MMGKIPNAVTVQTVATGGKIVFLTFYFIPFLPFLFSFMCSLFI